MAIKKTKTELEEISVMPDGSMEPGFKKKPPEKKRSSTRTKKGTIRKKPGKKAKPGPKGLDREKILGKLKKYLQLDLSVERACNAYNADEYDKSIIEKRKPEFIASQTVRDWIRSDEEFRGKVEFYQDTPNVLARQTWREKIAKGDYQAAKDWLERKEKSEFSTKTEVGVTDKDGNDVIDKVSIHILTVPHGSTNQSVTSVPEELPEPSENNDKPRGDIIE